MDLESDPSGAGREPAVERPFDLGSPIAAPQEMPESAGPQSGSGPTSLPAKREPRGTFELKFLVDAARTEQIMVLARAHLAADPYSDPQIGDGYVVNSLYLDTPTLQVYWREGNFGKFKLRLRRYGSEPRVWLERKRKRGRLVRKRRLVVDESELADRLTLPPDPRWKGRWFRKRVERQQLHPVSQVTYERFVRIGTAPHGPIRLTVDSNIRSAPACGWNVPTCQLDSSPLLGDERIVEFKFHKVMPMLFRNMIQDLGLTLTPFSKYRRSVENSLGGAPPCRAAQFGGGADA